MPHASTRRSLRLATLAVAALAAPSAGAQILSDQAWVQGAAGINFGVGFADLDMTTGELSAWCDYQGLQGDLVAVELRSSAGASIGSLQFDGAREGFTWGSFQLAGPELTTAAGGFDMFFLTSAFPAGEMAGAFSFQDPVTRVRFLDGAQVVGSAGATSASANMTATRYADGRVLLSAQTSGLDLPFTGLELRGPAWFGENGPLVLDLAPFDQSQAAHAFFVDIPAGTLTPEQLRDLDDGFQYLLVRTAAYPEGALRAQSALPGFLGDDYCAGRPNSQAVIGARLRLEGSPRIADGALTLVGEAFPSGSFVLPLAGRGTGHEFRPAGSQGNLCLGGAPIARLLDHITMGQGITDLRVTLDLAHLPAEAGVAAGESLQFQCWYRDVVGGVATSNFSSAISIRPR